MSVESARARFRASERRLMKSQITAVRDSGPPTYNPDTGAYTQPTTTIYTGDALVRMSAWEGADVGAGQTEIRLRPGRVKLPHAAVALRKDDRFTVTASDNPPLVGRTYRVTDFYGDDWSPSAPYFTEEVT